MVNNFDLVKHNGPLGWESLFLAHGHKITYYKKNLKTSLHLKISFIKSNKKNFSGKLFKLTSKLV